MLYALNVVYLVYTSLLYVVSILTKFHAYACGCNITPKSTLEEIYGIAHLRTWPVCVMCTGSGQVGKSQSTDIICRAPVLVILCTS